MFDVIIAGASFAGLAVASRLKGYRVLLLDRKPIGEGQTSACGTVLELMRHWGLQETVIQIHQSLVLHTQSGEIRLPSPYPWCTFDYRHFCEILYARSEAAFLKAHVYAFDGLRLHTSMGSFQARYIVDATGWRAVLASGTQTRGRQAREGMNMGMETIVPWRGQKTIDREALHFWYDGELLRGGVGWAFPRGG